MGVPQFYRWLTDKYPVIVESAVNLDDEKSDDFTDNLYLDLNGVFFLFSNLHAHMHAA